MCVHCRKRVDRAKINEENRFLRRTFIVIVLRGFSVKRDRFCLRGLHSLVLFPLLITPFLAKMNEGATKSIVEQIDEYAQAMKDIENYLDLCVCDLGDNFNYKTKKGRERLATRIEK